MRDATSLTLKPSRNNSMARRCRCSDSHIVGLLPICSLKNLSNVRTETLVLLASAPVDQLASLASSGHFWILLSLEFI